MKRLLFATAALVAFSVPASAATVETFEALAPKDVPLPTLATSVGVFNPIGGGAGNVFISSPGYNNYGTAVSPTTSSILTANGDEAFELLLAAPTQSISMDIYFNGLGPIFVEYFNGATLLGSYNLNSGPGGMLLNQFGVNFGPGTQITRMTFVSTLGGQLNTGIDNVTVDFLRTGVPEPATWALLIAGFGVVGGAMRTRRRAALAA